LNGVSGFSSVLSPLFAHASALEPGLDSARSGRTGPGTRRGGRGSI